MMSKYISESMTQFIPEIPQTEMLPHPCVGGQNMHVLYRCWAVNKLINVMHQCFSTPSLLDAASQPVYQLFSWHLFNTISRASLDSQKNAQWQFLVHKVLKNPGPD